MNSLSESVIFILGGLSVFFLRTLLLGASSSSSSSDLDLVEIVTSDLFFAVVHPDLRIDTMSARKILPDKIDLHSAVKQWGNIAGLIAGLEQGNQDMISRSFIDVIIEPLRSKLIPNYYSIKNAAINSLRLGINTTLGIGGLFDVASYYGLKKRDKEDYGQTLGAWGLPEGCYFVLPVLGPTTVRDSLGSLASFSGGDAWYNVTIANDTQYFTDDDYYVSRLSTGVDFRAKNLEAFNSLEKSSLDLYASVRSLYLQDRERKIKNLDITTETMSDDDWEELDSQ